MDDVITKTIAVYDTIATDYAQKIEDYAPSVEREKFLTYLPHIAMILDAGCGPGRDSAYFANKGHKVIGIDLSEKFLHIAQKKSPKVEFCKMDLRQISFPRAKFDGVWACASLLHLKRTEISSVLQKFHDILKKNGVLFISVKEGTGEADVTENLSSQLSRHFTYFQVKELQKLLIDAGFSSLEIYTWNEKDRDPKRRDLIWISSFSKRI